MTMVGSPISCVLSVQAHDGVTLGITYDNTLVETSTLNPSHAWERLMGRYIPGQPDQVEIEAVLGDLPAILAVLSACAWTGDPILKRSAWFLSMSR